MHLVSTISGKTSLQSSPGVISLPGVIMCEHCCVQVLKTTGCKNIPSYYSEMNATQPNTINMNIILTYNKYHYLYVNIIFIKFMICKLPNKGFFLNWSSESAKMSIFLK